MGKLPGKIWIERTMIESKAYLSLTGFAPQLLTLVLGKRQFDKQGRKGKEKWICINEDSINITYPEFERKYGITQPRLTKAIDALLAKGFLSRVYPGGLYRHDKARFALIDKWRWWTPGVIFEVREKEQVERGFCKPKKEKIAYENVTIHINENVTISQN